MTGVTRLAASGGTVYLGGSFSSIGGQVRPGLAAVDLATAALLPWNPQLVFGRGVSQIVPMPGGTVFADGVAATGAARRRLVEIDAGGAVTSWAPEAFAESITAVRLSDTGTLLVGSPLAAHGGTRAGRSGGVRPPVRRAAAVGARRSARRMRWWRLTASSTPVCSG